MPPTDDDDAARRAAKGTTERASFPGLPKLVLGVQVPARQEQDETPAASPEARARARARRNTLAGMPAPAPQVTLPPPPVPKRPYQRSVSPVPWDDPPEARREAARHGDRVVTAPVSVPPPSPSSGFAVDVQAGGQRVRVQGGGGIARKVWPWLAPVVLSVVGTVVGYAKGYFEGLAAAGRRVAAIEEGLRLNGEDDARRATRATSDVNRAFVMLDDHDARIPRLEKRAEKIEQNLPKIEGLKPPPK